MRPFAIAAILAVSSAAPCVADQLVYLDFTTTGHSIPAGDIYAYSVGEQIAIKSYLESMYAPYGITFTLTAPPPFTASTVKFNNGPAGGYGDHIDFRNLSSTDDCYVNGKGGLALFPGTPLTPPNITFASANLAAHELGHIMGLRHHDSFGPIGGGIGVSAGAYSPAYPGPTSGGTTSLHVMSLASTVALSGTALVTSKTLSQRDAIKLEFNRSGLTVPEGPMHASVPTAMPITLMPMTIANPTKLPESDPITAPTFSASALAVTGSLDMPAAGDYYKFTGIAGDRVTIEVISAAMGPDLSGRIADPCNPFVALLDDVGVLVPYAGMTMAINDNEYETTDSILFDVFLPHSGTFIIEVGLGFIVGGPPDTGSYELFVYSTRPVPAPGAASALLLLGLAAGRRRRVR